MGRELKVAGRRGAAPGAGLVAVALLAAGLLAGAPAAAQTGEWGGRRHIAVSGEGRVSARPDIAYADLGIRVTGQTAGQAMGEARGLMGRVVDALRQAGVAEKDVMTSQFAVYRERVPGPRSVGSAEGDPVERYVVNNMVRVTVRDLERADAVLDGAIDAGANEVSGIRFGIEDQEQVAAEARRLAAAQARAKAEQLAGLHQMRLGRVIRIAEGGAGPGPEPMYARAARLAEAAATVEVGELTFTARLDVVYEMKAD